jgi:type II secretory pathway pseudopilin PulG
VAARRVAARARGRAWVALALLGFVLVGAAVIWRRAQGHAQAKALLALEQQRLQLQSQRAQLRSDIRDLVSRSSLAAVVEKRLDMHVPNDTQLVILTRPRRAAVSTP